MNTTTLELSILGPAFVAGLLVLATHVPLGMEVLRRGIIFIDLAIAQMAGLGALAGSAVLARCRGWRRAAGGAGVFPGRRTRRRAAADLDRAALPRACRKR